jgi:hypothetical protein
MSITPWRLMEVIFSEKLNVGFIGLRKVAESHLEGYKEVDQIQVIAGAEVSPERLKI